jgi:hypothetical protein
LEGLQIVSLRQVSRIQTTGTEALISPDCST